MKKLNLYKIVLNLPIICNKLAEYKNLDVEYVSKVVFENSKRFFNVK